MNGKIYKVVPEITKEEILQVCEFKGIPNYGTVMTFQKFTDAVDEEYITDYDGSGKLILNDKVVMYTSTWIRNRCVYFIDKFIIPFNVLYSIFGDDVKFIWFNK